MLTKNLIDSISISLSKPITLSIAAPAFNEEAGIANLIKSWRQFLSTQQEVAQFEIVICNDGSSDKTGFILDQMAQLYPEVRLIHFKKNQGAAAALYAAIEKTCMDWILLTDCDNQFPIEDFPKMLNALRASPAFAALGTRMKKEDLLFARFGSWASGYLCNLIHGSKIKDFNSAFKLVWGTLLRSMTLEVKELNYSTEITSRLLECRASIVQVSIRHQVRSFGKSKMKILKGSFHRFLFICYLAFRQLLLKLKVLNRPTL